MANEGQVVAAIENSVRQSLRLPDVQSFVYAEAPMRPPFGGRTARRPDGTPRFNETSSDPVGSDDSVGSARVGEPTSPVLQRLSAPGEPGVATTHDVDDQLALTFVAPAEAKVAVAEDAAMWQVHNQYILVEVANGLLFVDQQAAHERVNYDRAMEQMAGVAGASQQLLFPIQLEMGAAILRSSTKYEMILPSSALACETLARGRCWWKLFPPNWTASAKAMFFINY